MVSKLFSQFDELIKKFDSKYKNESFEDLDTTSKNISELNIILSSLLKIVYYL